MSQVKYKIKYSEINHPPPKRTVYFEDGSYAYDHGEKWMYKGKELAKHPDKQLIVDAMQDWFLTEDFNEEGIDED